MAAMTDEQARMVLKSFQWKPETMQKRQVMPRHHVLRPAVQHRILEQERPLTLIGELHAETLLSAAYEAGIDHSALEANATKLDVVELIRQVLERVGISIQGETAMVNLDEAYRTVEEAYDDKRTREVWVGGVRMGPSEDGDQWQTQYGPVISFMGSGANTRIVLTGLDIALLKDFGVDFPNASRLYDSRESWQTAR